MRFLADEKAEAGTSFLQDKQTLMCRRAGCTALRGSEGIEGAFVKTGGGEASQDMRCLTCDARWTDIYTLDYVLMGSEEAGDGVSP